MLYPSTAFYTPEELEDWRQGHRDAFPDGYWKRGTGTFGFGESVVARYFMAIGYQCIHHDYDIFGSNRPQKYPKSEEILVAFLGTDRLAALRQIHRLFWPLRDRGRVPVEVPDLLIYKADFSELRFAESKLLLTRDKLNPRQILGLALISSLLRSQIDLFYVAAHGTSPKLEPVRQALPWSPES